MFVFLISSKNQSRCKLNHLNQKRPHHSYFSHYQSSHIRSYSEIFKIFSSDLDSPQKMGLDTSWIISIREHFLTTSWTSWTDFLDSNHCLCTDKDLEFWGELFWTILYTSNVMCLICCMVVLIMLSLLNVWYTYCKKCIYITIASVSETIFKGFM